MRTISSTPLLLGLLLTGSLGVACGDDTGGGQGGSGGGSTTSSSGGGSTTSTASGTGGTGGQGGSGGEGGGGVIGPFESCNAGGFVECFSNYDCANASTRCQNVNTELDPVACCVPGTRGTGERGTPCSGENDCKSAICIEKDGQQSQCSDTCTGPNDCGGDLPNCAPILFSGSEDDWCQPAPSNG